MNPNEYIESGILERYVLGQCTPEEIKEVQCMARVFNEVQNEIDAIEATLQTYAQMQAVAPPVALKAKIIAQLDTLSSDMPDAKHHKLPETKVVSIQQNTSNFKWQMLAAACLVLALGLGYLYNHSNNQRIELNNKLDVSQNDLATWEQNNSNLKQRLQKADALLAMVNDTAIQQIQMKGLAIAQNALATIYWNKQDKQVYLNINNLPQPKQGQQFQLWAIADGKPVDLGVFDVNTDSMVIVKMKEIQNPQAFAVTLEPAGGSISPTMDQMYVMGSM